MKNKKLIPFLLSMMIIIPIGGCNKNSDDSSSTESSTTISSSVKEEKERDVNYPKDIPVYGEDSFQIHYQRKDNTYSPWSLWLWSENKDGARYEFNYMDDEFVIASYKLSDFDIDLSTMITKMGFIVAKNPGTTWDAKDTANDRFIDFESLEKDANSVYHVYIYQDDANTYIDGNKTILDKVEYVRFNDEKTIAGQATNTLSEYEIFENGVSILKGTVPKTKKFTATLPNDYTFSYSNIYTSKVTFAESKNTHDVNISMQLLYTKDSFNDAFYYSGELGAIYSASETTFRVWSPVSSKIVLKLYENGTPEKVDELLGSDVTYREIELEKKDKGVFETTVSGDLDGMYYTYTVINSKYPNGKEIVDPYAKSTGINGLRGMIVNFENTNPINWNETIVHPYDRKELTVYETHVADITSSSTWNGNVENSKKFLGLIEEGTTYTKNDIEVKTGFDHIKELGVNAVQLIPIFDQANDEVNPTFNWGYNPLNYNTLEGSYSSDPYDGYARIREFKQVVQKYNEAGMNIIMDVVYNHTNSVEGTNFDVLMPGYYYRYTYSGALYNGSGCGNETASENAMMRKFMIDSACFLASEYKLGGYRFDLMGLHDIKTMNLLVEEVNKINPNIVIYGEPWTGGTSGLATSEQAIQSNANTFKGYGQFNDRMRDELIKGGMSAATERSWISNVEDNKTIIGNLIGGIKGITKNLSLEIADPDKTVNYVTCHDNYTLYDRFKACGIEDDAMVKKMAMLANSVVFTSQGTTFMLAGEEFLRTKGGNHNSYNATYEINELNYELKVDNMDMFNNYQKLIALKQNIDGLHLDKEAIKTFEVSAKNSNNVISYKIQDSNNNKEYYIIHSNGVNEDVRVEFNLEGYSLYLDTLNEINELGKVKPKAFQTIIAYR